MTCLLCMLACDTFCDELLLHMLFQSTVITLLLMSGPVFMKYVGKCVRQEILSYCPRTMCLPMIFNAVEGDLIKYLKYVYYSYMHIKCTVAS